MQQEFKETEAKDLDAPAFNDRGQNGY